MAPKFRGRSDDWLDDQRFRLGKRAGTRDSKARKGVPGGKGTDLPWELANAVVSEVYPKLCRVRLLETASDQPETEPSSLQLGEELLCHYRRINVFRQGEADELRERTPVAVGDRVRVEGISGGSAVVEGLCQRKNSLSRPAPGDETGKRLHVIAANVDLLVIVASVREPEFSPGLVDRYLVAASAAGIPALICTTKVDLVESGPLPVQSNLSLYRKLGYEVLEVSSRAGVGVSALKERLLGKTVVFSGKSGVGKTSLLRNLLGEEVGRVGEVSSATGKGRHTTTSSVLLGGPDGSKWIDTPGVREFGLIGVSTENLCTFFPEFAGLDCTLSGCFHSEEVGCLARDLGRYESYRRILESLREGTA